MRTADDEVFLGQEDDEAGPQPCPICSGTGELLDCDENGDEFVRVCPRFMVAPRTEAP